MAGQPKHRIISNCDYDKTAHGGYGKGQKLLTSTAGTEKGATKHAGSAIARDGVEGHGTPKRGYQTDAHSGLYHGRSGEAVGHRSDIRPNSYDSPLHSEGDGMSHVGAKIPGRAGAASARAEHHPVPTGNPHRFKEGSANAAHGYGHAPGQRSGPLRMSGHTKGHQVGKR